MAHHLADPWLVRLLAQPGRPLEAHLQQPERLVVPCCPQVQWPERLLVARRQHLEVLLLEVHVVALVVGLVDHVVGTVEVVQVDLVVVLEVKVLRWRPIPSRLQSHWWCFCAVVPWHSRIHRFLLELVRRDVSSPWRRGH